MHCSTSLPTASRQCGDALQEFPAHCPQAVWRCAALIPCPLPPSIVAVHCRRSLPTAPRQSGGALQPFPCTLPSRSVSAHCNISIAHCPGHCGIALQQFHCLLPPSSVALHCSSSTASCPQAVWRCITGDPMPTASLPAWQCSTAHTVQRSAQHQAPSSAAQHTKVLTVQRSIHGAVSHCAQASAEQHRLGATVHWSRLYNNTLAHSAHLDTQPSRLPVPVGRHPGHCILVTAPSAHHTTPNTKHHAPRTTHRSPFTTLHIPAQVFPKQAYEVCKSCMKPPQRHKPNGEGILRPTPHAVGYLPLPLEWHHQLAYQGILQ